MIERQPAPTKDGNDIKINLGLIVRIIFGIQILLSFDVGFRRLMRMELKDVLCGKCCVKRSYLIVIKIVNKEGWIGGNGGREE